MLCIASAEDGYFKVLNPAWEKTLGFTREELLSKPLLEFIHPDDRASTMSEVEKQLKGQSTSYFENRYICKDGSYRWLSWTATPAKGNLLYATARDITEHKKAEDALEEREQKHRRLFESMAQGVVYQDDNGEIISANPAAEIILGLTTEQMMGRKSIDPRWRSVHENGSDFPGDTHPSIVALKTGTTVSNVVMGVFHPKNEEYRWILINAIPEYRSGDKKPFQVFTTFTDITERKQAEEALQASEERLRLTTNQVPAVLWTTDTELKFTSSTGAGLDALGLKTDQVVGMTLFEYLQTDDPENLVIKAYYQAIKGNSANYEFEWEGRVFDSHVKPLQDKEGSIIGTIGFALDITERKKAEEKLKESEDRYRRITDTITDYIYSVRVEGGRPVETKHSDPCFAVTGYTTKEFDNDPYLWIKIIVEEDHDLIRQQIEQVLSGQYPKTIEHRLIRKNNVMCWVESTMVPHYDRDKNLISYDGIVKDITERKQAELRVKDEAYLRGILLDNMPCTALILKKGTREIVASNEIAKKIGAVPSKTCFETCANRSSPCTFCNAPELWATDEPRQIEVEYEGVYYAGYWAPFSEDLYVHYIFDITERKKAEKTLRNTLDEKETLLQEVHHRVINNLLVLNGLVDLQKARLSGKEDINEILDDVKQRINTMGKVHQMLYQSKKLSEINYSEYISSIVNEIKNIYHTDEKKIDVSLYVESVILGIKAAVPCGLIINELLVNAYKHAFPDRDGHIIVSFKRKDDVIELQISDDGIGMSEDSVFQESESLGLHLVNMLTRQLNGEISYKRENGSMFRIVFKII